MATQPCVRCNGSKKYAPLGGILKTCDLCNGIGYMILDHATKSETKRFDTQGIQPIPTNDTIVKIRKKPGRKPGWNLPKPDTIQTIPETATITE